MGRAVPAKNNVKQIWRKRKVAIILFVTLNFVFPIAAWSGSTFWPISRFGVFIMGIYGGLLRLSCYDIKMRQDSENGQESLRCYDQPVNVWGIFFLVMLVLGSIGDTITDGWTGQNFWQQIGFVYWMLEFIILLTKCSKTNKVCRFLTSKKLLFFGRISYPLYLIHEPMIFYTCWIVNGSLKWPQCEESFDDDDSNDACNDEWDTFHNKRKMPNYCIPILCVVTIILSVCVHRMLI